MLAANNDFDAAIALAVSSGARIVLAVGTRGHHTLGLR
jgi:hypothetical protein